MKKSKIKGLKALEIENKPKFKELERINKDIAERCPEEVISDEEIDILNQHLEENEKVSEPSTEEELEKTEKALQEKFLEEKQKKFESFILDKEKLPQEIDHAVGSIKIYNKKLRYYGSFINQIIKEDRKGEMIEKKKLVPVLILENKEILSEHNKHLFNDIEFSFKTKMTLKNNRWALEGVSDFLKTEKYDDVSYKEVFEEFKQIFKESMVFEKQEWYDVQALWCMTTYFQDFQDKSLIIKLEGASGSAKSKTGKIMANLSFNGKKFLCPSFASFVRYRNNNKASLFIEEAEKLDEELVEALNGSYERGNVVPRQNKDDLNLTDEFDPYGWTMIGAINKLEGALKKRSITQYQIKAKKNDKRAEIEIPSDQDHVFLNARNKMYALGLLKYDFYLNKYNSLEKPSDLHNREWVVSKPLLTMAFCIDKKLFHSISEFLVQRFYVRDDEDVQEDSWEFILLGVLLDLTKTSREEKFISNLDLRYSFLNSINESYSKISSHSITKLMAKIGFGDFKRRNQKGDQRGYFLHFFKVCEIGIRTELIDIKFLEKKMSEVSFLSDNRFNREEIIKWYSDTFSDTDTFSKITSDTSDKKDRTDTFSEGVYIKKSDVDEVNLDD